MKVSRVGLTTAALAVSALALTACGSDNPTGAAGSGNGSQLSGTVTGIGASSQQAAMTAWQTGFQAEESGITVQYSPDGSGAGRKALLAGGANFAGSDAYLSDEEYEESKDVCGPEGAFQVPAYISPIAVAFNLPGVESLNLDPDTLAEIFQGEIDRWDDKAIATQNKGVDLPDTKITVVHRSDESGTTENFTEYLHAAAPKVWTDEASGEWPDAYASENNKGTSGVVQTTSATEGAITYADASAVGTLGTVAVKVGDGYVAHSAEAAALAVEHSTKVKGRASYDMAMDLERDTEADGAYPIVLVSYHVYCSQYDDQKTVDQLKAFGEYVVSADGQQAASDAAGSAPLSDALSEDAKKAIEQISVKS